MLGQNVLAAGILTVGISLLAAVVAKVIAVGLGLEDTIGLLDLATVSIVGGVLGSVGRAGRPRWPWPAVRSATAGTSTTSTPRWSRPSATC